MGYAPPLELIELCYNKFGTFKAYAKSVEPLTTISAGASAKVDSTIKIEGFDPGSERTLAAWLRHASRTDCSIYCSVSGERVSNG